MTKADIHIHSCFSDRPSEWFLQRLGTRESYTKPEKVYSEAKRRGMTWVTITDHNEIAASILLKEKYPDEVFTGVEVTTYFPENGCKIHVLVYGLNESQFKMINKARADIYDLRCYIKEQYLAHSVAHATYSINKKLTIENIERLVLLFDYFEGINGSRSRMGNKILMDALLGLTPETIDDLYKKYRIEPYSDTPWIKGLTGGSDDHGGLFFGKTFTSTDGDTPESFIDQLKKKRSSLGGRHNDYQGLAFAIYKIAYDFSKSKSERWSTPLFNAVNGLLFDSQSITLKNRLIVEKMKFSKAIRKNGTKRALVELVELFQKNKDLAVEIKLDMVYEKITQVADELFKKLMSSIESNIRQGDLLGLIQSISNAIPGIFLSLPFYTTINVLHNSRVMLNELSRTYGSTRRKRKKRILCFADFFDKINDRGSMCRYQEWLSHYYDANLTVVTCLPPDSKTDYIKLKTMGFPPIYSYTPSFFTSCTLQVPSVLASLKMIYEAEPDEIVISTLGPVGLLGILISRLLHVKCMSIYRPDFTDKAMRAIEDETVGSLIENFTYLFYSFSDKILVSEEKDILELVKRGYSREKIVTIGPRRKASFLPMQKPEVAAGLESQFVNYL